MQTVRLGRTGLQISRLCLGTMSYGTPGGKQHPWVLDEKAAQPFFRRAYEAGINFLDTADMYSNGVCEQITGRAVKEYWPSRADVVIATKIRHGTATGANRSGLSRKHVFEAVDASLKRLGTDYVDLLYIHRVDKETEMDETLDALEQVVRQGKAIYLGASSMWTWQFVKMREMQRARGYQMFVAMQNFYNLAYREEEREMIPYCVAEGVAVVPWSPIARGYLAGNRSDGTAKTDRARRDRMAQGYFGSRQDEAIYRRVVKLADEMGVKPAQIAYAWTLHKEAVTAPIVGATKLWQLDEAIAALDIGLTPAQVKRLEAPYRARSVLGHA